MSGGNLLVHCREQGAGAAGEVADAEPANGIGFAPIYPVHFAHRQPGQQRRGRRQSVVSSQILAVGNQALEDTSGQIVAIVDSRPAYFADRVLQLPQNTVGVGRRQLIEYIATNGEYRPSN